EVEVAHELSDHRELLRVLPAEVRDRRTDDVEELEADRRDAPEVAWAVCTLEPLGGAFGLDPRGESAGVERGRIGREEHGDAVLCGEGGVARAAARVGG